MQIFSVYISGFVKDEISNYVDEIAKESVSDAVKWYKNIIEVINSLNQTPTRCPQADETTFHDFEIRYLIFGNYRILFRIEKDMVQILHIKHSKMKREPIDKTLRIQRMITSYIPDNISLSEELMKERREEKKLDD